MEDMRSVYENNIAVGSELPSGWQFSSSSSPASPFSSSLKVNLQFAAINQVKPINRAKRINP